MAVSTQGFSGGHPNNSATAPAAQLHIFTFPELAITSTFTFESARVVLISYVPAAAGPMEVVVSSRRRIAEVSTTKRVETRLIYRFIGVRARKGAV